MANQVSKLLNHVVSVFDANPLVHTIVFKDDDVVDVEKENVYPLVSIRLIESPEQEPDVYFESMEISVINQRDKLPISTPSKLMSDVNYIDNINICSSILNDFYLEILKSHNDLDIDIFNKSSVKPVSKDERNGLDGKVQEFTFSLHQNAI